MFRDQSVAPAGALQLSRRAVLRMMAGGAAAAVLPLRHAIGTATTVPQVPPPQGFLTTDEVVILDALTAYIVPTDSQPGARECGVVNYIQSMLSFPPWSDVNCDQGVDAADLTAAVMQRSGAPSACGASGDLDGNGVIDAADVAAGEAAVFGARPFFAGGPFSGRQPQPHFFTGTTACQSCHTPTTSLALAWRPASAPRPARPRAECGWA